MCVYIYTDVLIYMYTPTFASATYMHGHLKCYSYIMHRHLKSPKQQKESVFTDIEIVLIYTQTFEIEFIYTQTFVIVFIYT